MRMTIVCLWEAQRLGVDRNNFSTPNGCMYVAMVELSAAIGPSRKSRGAATDLRFFGARQTCNGFCAQRTHIIARCAVCSHAHIVNSTWLNHNNRSLLFIYQKHTFTDGWTAVQSRSCLFTKSLCAPNRLQQKCMYFSILNQNNMRTHDAMNDCFDLLIDLWINGGRLYTFIRICYTHICCALPQHFVGV